MRIQLNFKHFIVYQLMSFLSKVTPYLYQS